MLFELRNDAPLLQLVDLDDRGKQLEVITGVSGELLERRDILAEAAATPPDPRAEEVRPKAVVEPNALRDAFDVGPDELADVGDLVDETDPCREKRVRGELDHLRGGDIGLNDRGLDT